MNLELMKAGFPPTILPVESKMEYYTALDRAHVDGDDGPFLMLMADIVKASFEPYWFSLGIGND